MSSAPYIAMYPTDFLADVGHLGNTELGIYWRLLLVYYRDGRPLPLDADRLRRIAMTFSPEECRALEAVVAEFFTLSAEPDGTRVWRHKRADRELDRANKYLEGKRRGAAKAREKLADKRSHPASRGSDIKADDSLISELIPGGEPEPDIDISDEDKSSSSSTGSSTRAARLPACPFEAIQDAYNEILPELPKAVKLTAKRKRAMRSAWQFALTSKRSDGKRRAETPEQAMEWLRAFFRRARDNDFVMGLTAKAPGHESWRANLDYLLSDSGMTQVIEKTTTTA